MIVKLDKKLQKAFTNDRALSKEYGDLAKRISIVYSQLRLADNLGDVPDKPPTKRHKLIGDKKGCWSVGIKNNWKFVIKPITETDDPRQIKEIEILSIEDYH